MGRVATVLFVSFLTTCPQLGPPDALARGDDQPLVVLSVVDEETGLPIDRFRILPGTPYRGRGEEPIATWQPHLIRESTDGLYEWPRYETFQLRAEADGYQPSSTPWIPREGAPLAVTIQLRRDPGFRGVVLAPDGSPAAGATLGISLPNRTIRLSGRTIDHADEPPAASLADRWRQPFTVRADADGRFELPTETDPSALLVVVHEAGYLEQPFEALFRPAPESALTRELRLSAWGRIEGQVFWFDHPGVDEPVQLIVSREFRYPDMLFVSGKVRSDARGRFTFEDIPPGHVQLARLVPAPNGDGNTSFQFPLMHVEVRAGDATEVVLGGRGRVVTGRLTGLDSYAGVTLNVQVPAPPFGFGFRDNEDDSSMKGYFALKGSPLGASLFQASIPVDEDGTYRIEGLVPGSYQLSVNDGGRGHRGHLSLTVHLPDGEDEDRPQELDDLEVRRISEEGESLP